MSPAVTLKHPRSAATVLTYGVLHGAVRHAEPRAAAATGDADATTARQAVTAAECSRTTSRASTTADAPHPPTLPVPVFQVKGGYGRRTMFMR